MTVMLSVLCWLATEPPSPGHLVRTAIAARERQEKQGWQFTWREDVEQRRAGRRR